MVRSIEEVLKKHKGHAFMHLQDDFMIAVIEASLKECNNNIKLVADTLGISHQTVTSWCDKLGINYKTRQYLCESKLKLKETHIRRALLKHRTIEKASKSLGVSRVTLIRQMKKLNIESNSPRRGLQIAKHC